jgi:ABC-type multidrug transport system ATPase subunit
VTIQASPLLEAEDVRVPSLLSLRGVNKQWERRAHPVLRDVELALGRGEIALLIGENGAGKTTFLRIVAGLIFPDSGVVELDGLDPRRNRVEYQRRIGFVSAGSTGLYARLSARRHLDFAARIAFVRGFERAIACEDAISRFGLDDFAARRVDRLSMGQRQRVRLAMAFVHRPQLLLLDEPVNSLDERGAHDLASALDDFRASGGTAVCCVPTGGEPAARLPDADLSLRMESGRLLPA